MTYPVNSVADYIIEYAKDQESYVNNLQLQKILYYLEARFLVEGKGSLFEEPIEKWRYGPVIPKVYYRFNHLGAENITHVPIEFDFMSLLNEPGNTEEHVESTEFKNDRLFSETDKPVIDNTIKSLIGLDPFYLVDETHKHLSWIEDEERILNGVRHIKYERESIKNDFANHTEFRLWLN